MSLPVYVLDAVKVYSYLTEKSMDNVPVNSIGSTMLAMSCSKR